MWQRQNIVDSIVSVFVCINLTYLHVQVHTLNFRRQFSRPIELCCFVDVNVLIISITFFSNRKSSLILNGLKTFSIGTGIVCWVDFKENLGFGTTLPNLQKFCFPQTDTVPISILTQFMKAQGQQVWTAKLKIPLSIVN